MGRINNLEGRNKKMGNKDTLKQKMQSMEDKTSNVQSGKEHPTTNTNMGKFQKPNRPSI
jgi:hypothetical protein